MLSFIGKENGAEEKKIEEAKMLLKKAGYENPSERQTFEEIASGSLEILKKIAKNKETMKALISLGFIKFGFYFFYYGALSCLERTGYSFGLSILILGLSE